MYEGGFIFVLFVILVGILEIWIICEWFFWIRMLFWLGFICIIEFIFVLFVLFIKVEVIGVGFVFVVLLGVWI